MGILVAEQRTAVMRAEYRGHRALARSVADAERGFNGPFDHG